MTRIIDGKHVVLVDPKITQSQLIRIAEIANCSLKRHASGAIEMVPKVGERKVVPIDEQRQKQGKKKPSWFQRARDFTYPDHEPEPTPPGAA